MHTDSKHSEAITLILTNSRRERAKKFVMRERNGEGNIPQESVGVVQMLKDTLVMSWAYHGVSVCSFEEAVCASCSDPTAQ